MKTKNSNWFSTITQCGLLLVVLILPQATEAKTWQATAGAQSNNLGRQALAFLPNEYGFTPATKSLGLSRPRRSIR